MKLELKDISGGYIKGQNVLYNINLSINKSDAVSIIGQNGAGKSSIAKAILGLLPYKTGVVTFNGIDITKWQSKDIANSGIGFFVQGGMIFPHLTVYENLALAGNRLSRKMIEKRISSIAEYIGFLKVARLNIAASYLSGGERHQLALAMVLMLSPSLIILDEPSAGLSPKLVDELYTTLEYIREEKQIGVLLIEQNISKAIDFTQRIILMRNGRIEFNEQTSRVLQDNSVIKLIF